jgi:AraC-like DNA-binding protein
MMMQPGEVHTTLSHTAPGTFRVLFVQARELERVAEGLDFVGTLNLRMGQLDCVDVHRTFVSLHESIERDGTPLEQQTRMLRCLEAFLEHCTESRPGAGGSVAGPVLARAREYIHAHFCEQITLDEIAKNAGASPFHLDRTFSAAFGAPMHAYLLLLRVNAARHLLRRKSRPVDIAGALGFADQAHFTRTFKRMVGVTPNNYVTATRQR